MDPKLMIDKLIDDGRLRIVQVVGSGSFATVYLAESTTTPVRHYAVKTLFKRGLSVAQLELQLRELKFLDLVSPHPNIVTLYKSVQDENYLHFIMEFAPNDLFDFISDMETMTDEVIKDMFSQIVSAVKHCHERGVFHRDLKPENILTVPVSTTCEIPKITDFGLATQDMYSRDFGCGSIRYIAPECLLSSQSRSYSPAKSDIWALGIILINLISGKNPWRRADSSDEYFNCYKTDPFFWTAFGVSPAAQGLVNDILCIDPKRRISLAEIEKRLPSISEFRVADGIRDMGDRESTIATTVDMEREHRSWNSWNSEMSFAHPLVFGEDVVPDELRIKSPHLNFDDDLYTDDDDEGMIFPPMDDDEEEIFAKVLVRGQVPAFVSVNNQNQVSETPKKKRNKSKKPKQKFENAIEEEPHEFSESASPTIPIPIRVFSADEDVASTPIAIPRGRALDGGHTPTQRNEIATMTDSYDDDVPTLGRTLTAADFNKRSLSPPSRLNEGTGSKTPPGMAINARNTLAGRPSKQFDSTPQPDNRSPSNFKMFDRPSNSDVLLSPPVSKPTRTPSPHPNASSNFYANRSSYLSPSTPRNNRSSPGVQNPKRNSPPLFSSDRTPRKQDFYQSPSSSRTPSRNVDYFGYHHADSLDSRSNAFTRKTETYSRPPSTFVNRSSSSSYITPPANSRSSFGSRTSTPFKTTTKNIADYISPVNKNYFDHKWTKSSSHGGFAKSFGGSYSAFGKGKDDGWRKQEEWQPFGGLIDFGWDKAHKKDSTRREWKKREVM